MENNSKIKLALIGCGRIANKHFEALENLTDQIELIAVCDKFQDKANQAAVRMGCKAYYQIDEMLTKEQLDIVTIASPNGMHPAHIKQVATSGCHVITEKPLAINYKEGKEIVSFCQAQQKELFVIYQNRFNPTIELLRKAIDLNGFGQIYMINSNVYWTRPQSYFDKEGDWHGTKKIDGGAFYTQASHYIDLMQLIAAKPIKSVVANLKRLKRHIETEDTGIAQFEWENGIIGSANLTVLTYPKNLEGSITIIGENGTVKIGGVALNHIECWQFADQKCQQLWQPTNSNYSTESVYGFGHKSYYQNVVETLKGNAKAEVSGEEGLKSLQILDAIYQSNENKKTIYFHQGDSE